MKEMKFVRVTLEVFVEVPVDVDPADVVVVDPASAWDVEKECEYRIANVIDTRPQGE